MRKTLTPAYGRDYRSAKAAKADFLGGMDFVIADISDPYDGKPANLQDMRDAGISEVTLRFQNLTKLTVVKVPAS